MCTNYLPLQGTLFIMISENTYHPMYSVLDVFPQGFPLFMRETRSGLYTPAHYYVANILAMVGGSSLSSKYLINASPYASLYSCRA